MSINISLNERTEFLSAIEKGLTKKDLASILFEVLSEVNSQGSTARQLIVSFNGFAETSTDYACERWHAGTAWGMEREARDHQTVLDTFERNCQDLRNINADERARVKAERVRRSAAAAALLCKTCGRPKNERDLCGGDVHETCR